MRVLLACPYALDVPGGVQNHVRQLAAELGGRGHDVLVLAPATARGAVAEPSARVVGRAARIPYGGTVAPICFSRRSFRRIGRLMDVFEPDVVHAHEPFAPSTSMLATVAASAPVVGTFHAYAERTRLLEVAAPVLRRLHRRLAASVAVSEAAAEQLGRAVTAEVEIVPNGVDVARFSDAGPAEGLPPGRRVLWVNRLDPQKGFAVAVRAFARLAADMEDVSLVVAGEGRERAALGLLTERDRRRVVMLGSVPNEEVSAYHAAADVFVAPALDQESFGIVLVEAMAAGVPVVASDIPGYREVVRDGVDGLLVPRDDPNALARAVRRVLEDPALAEALRRGGRERAREFSWDEVTPRIEAIYRRVVEAGSRA